MENVQVLIVGGGLAGISAALWCQRLGLACVLIEAEPTLGGQLQQIHNEIWDFPPHIYKNGQALLAELQQNRKLAQLDCRFSEELKSIDYKHKVVTTSKQHYHADYVIIATGVRPNTVPALAGSKRLLPPRFSTSAQAELFRQKKVLVIGGGDRALESTWNLSAFADKIWLIVRSDTFRARNEWVERVAQLSNVEVWMQSEAVGYRDEPAETVVEIRRTVAAVPASLTLAVDWILPRIGVRPVTGALASLHTDEHGYIVANTFQQSNLDWIYAIGDVTAGAAYASLSLALGQAMKAAKHISLRIKEN
ncbi:FAD-dependent oxidoreductase [Brevibacillus fulvus]|uniref:Thioredoxin reductase (NADPH) n=1 Tax=Brevibacillus fulvus TaxID=1125967 RepID=A0A938Y1B5_9BACL|nr:thioredoxin reductase (NADPH) [Brevibacillus fulvus]